MGIRLLLIVPIIIAAIAIAGCSSSTELQLGTKNSPGIVTVDLTPVRYDDGALIIEMAVNTHIVDGLDRYDLREIVALEANGKHYTPVNVFPLRGHHSYGEVEFGVGKLPDEFTITIDNLHDEGVREFRWP